MTSSQFRSKISARPYNLTSSPPLPTIRHSSFLISTKPNAFLINIAHDFIKPAAPVQLKFQYRNFIVLSVFIQKIAGTMLSVFHNPVKVRNNHKFCIKTVIFNAFYKSIILFRKNSQTHFPCHIPVPASCLHQC